MFDSSISRKRVALKDFTSKNICLCINIPAIDDMGLMLVRNIETKKSNVRQPRLHTKIFQAFCFVVRMYSLATLPTANCANNPLWTYTNFWECT